MTFNLTLHTYETPKDDQASLRENVEVVMEDRIVFEEAHVPDGPLLEPKIQRSDEDRRDDDDPLAKTPVVVVRKPCWSFFLRGRNDVVMLASVVAMFVVGLIVIVALAITLRSAGEETTTVQSDASFQGPIVATTTTQQQFSQVSSDPESVSPTWNPTTVTMNPTMIPTKGKRTKIPKTRPPTIPPSAQPSTQPSTGPSLAPSTAPSISSPPTLPIRTQGPVFGIMVVSVPMWNETDMIAGISSVPPTINTSAATENLQWQDGPTFAPSNRPTNDPWVVFPGKVTNGPTTVTRDPVTIATPQPSMRPSKVRGPTQRPTSNTVSPSDSPTVEQSLESDTLQPTTTTTTTSEPTQEWTLEPTKPPKNNKEKDDKEEEEEDDDFVPTMSAQPSQAPTKRPTFAPTVEPGRPTRRPTHRPTPPTDEMTFVPGLLTVQQEGLTLSTGLTARLIAESGRPVQYQKRTPEALGATQSAVPFHGQPDGAATFVDPSPTNPGGWIYVSNSEETDNRGGVGAITFDGTGQIIKYEMLLTGTSWNCNGGKTPWNTWISCEESGDGVIYQVDPTGKRSPQVLTMGSQGGTWECFAYDVRNVDLPRFFVTEDEPNGALQRFTPNGTDWSNEETMWNMLHGPGVTEYLLLQPNFMDASQGSYSWSSDLEVARQNAESYYPNTEGVAVHDGIMYFVCKEIQMLFALNLDTMTYARRSTASGLFDGEPDQLQRILSTGGEQMLFFTEDGGELAGVHGRDETGLFFTILESEEYTDETAGLAFSPDYRHMYIAYQDNGLLFEVTRTDGHPFSAKSLQVKYHSTSLASNRQRGRNFDKPE